MWTLKRGICPREIASDFFRRNRVAERVESDLRRLLRASVAFPRWGNIEMCRGRGSLGLDYASTAIVWHLEKKEGS